MLLEGTMTKSTDGLPGLTLQGEGVCGAGARGSDEIADRPFPICFCPEQARSQDMLSGDLLYFLWSPLHNSSC